MGKKRAKKVSANGKPFVSVCTPTYNRRIFIPNLIRCFKSQTYPKQLMEWIVIDDGENRNSFLTEIKKIEFVTKINEDGSKLTLFASNGTEVIPKIFQISSKLEIKIKSISLTQPTLDDVFISYTGHEIKGDESGFNRKREHAKMKRLRA